MNDLQLALNDFRKAVMDTFPLRYIADHREAVALVCVCIWGSFCGAMAIAMAASLITQ